MLLKKLNFRAVIGYPHDMIEKLVTGSISKLKSEQDKKNNISFTFVLEQDQVCFFKLTLKNQLFNWFIVCSFQSCC